jgi:hypothetical protein
MKAGETADETNLPVRQYRAGKKGTSGNRSIRKIEFRGHTRLLQKPQGVLEIFLAGGDIFGDIKGLFSLGRHSIIPPRRVMTAAAGAACPDETLTPRGTLNAGSDKGT